MRGKKGGAGVHVGWAAVPPPARAADSCLRFGKSRAGRGCETRTCMLRTRREACGSAACRARRYSVHPRRCGLRFAGAVRVSGTMPCVAGGRVLPSCQSPPQCGIVAGEPEKRMTGRYELHVWRSIPSANLVNLIFRLRISKYAHTLIRGSTYGRAPPQRPQLFAYPNLYICNGHESAIRLPCLRCALGAHTSVSAFDAGQPAQLACGRSAVPANIRRWPRIPAASAVWYFQHAHLELSSSGKG